MPGSVRSAWATDLPAVARIHKSQFSDHLLGKYSIELLARFYKEFLGRTLFLVHETSPRIDGFLVGGDDGSLACAKAAFVRVNRARCIGETLLRPKVWLTTVVRGSDLLVSYRHKGQLKSGTPITSDVRLLSIAVAAEAVGTGAATELVQAFERTLKGTTESYGLSVKRDNHRAVAFYHKLGFELESESGESLYLRRSLKRVR